MASLKYKLLNFINKYFFDRYLAYNYVLKSDMAVSQKILMSQYSNEKGIIKRNFGDVGFGIYSQNDEDGIILYIFALIGVVHYRAVEMCAGNGIECNTANLLLNHRWTGLLIDGNPENIKMAKNFYRSRIETKFWPPDIIEAWLTRENVNDVLVNAGYSGEIRENVNDVLVNAGYSGEIDLLSMDVDGVDFYLLEAITVIHPRVIVLEYNHLLGPEVSLSVPYRPDFVAEFTEYGSDYAGASIQAFIKICSRKGYRFVGTNMIGTNAFFVRNDIAHDLLPEANPVDAFRHPRAQFGVKVRYQGIKNKEWVEV